MKNYVAHLVVVVSIALTGCLSDGTKDIQGKWAIDMNATIERAQRIGVASRELQYLREEYDGARMHVMDRKLVVSIYDETDTMDIPYKLASSGHGCHKLNLTLEGKDTPAQYCLRNGLLEVGNPTLSWDVAIYRRVS